MTNNNENRKVVLIIQARMGSTRLKGKSMMTLAGTPIVGHILKRIKLCKMIDEIVLAIPNTKQDIVLKTLGKSFGVKVFMGSEDDLVERYYQAAKMYGADIVGRFPADNPVPEPSEIDRIIIHHLSLDRPGFSSNLSAINNSGYPDGIGAEIFDFSLLEEIRHYKDSKMKREHLHLNFYDYVSSKPVNSLWCPVSTIDCPKEFRRPDLILDVNTQEQYHFMCQLYEDIYFKNSNFHITDIIKWYDEVYLKKESNNFN